MDLLNAGGADFDGIVALHSAAEHGRYQMAKSLIEKSADVNVIGFEDCISDSKSKEVGPALHFAVDGNSIDVAKLLLENGADMEVQDVEGRTSIQRAAQKEKKESKSFLEEARTQKVE